MVRCTWLLFVPFGVEVLMLEIFTQLQKIHELHNKTHTCSGAFSDLKKSRAGNGS